MKLPPCLYNWTICYPKEFLIEVWLGSPIEDAPTLDQTANKTAQIKPLSSFQIKKLSPSLRKLVFSLLLISILIFMKRELKNLPPHPLEDLF